MGVRQSGADAPVRIGSGDHAAELAIAAGVVAASAVGAELALSTTTAEPELEVLLELVQSFVGSPSSTRQPVAITFDCEKTESGAFCCR
jgi:hypothetical protein